MPAYDNTAVAAKLELAAGLLELEGAEKYRYLSYRKAASAVRAWPEQVATLAEAGRLTDIPGVGDKMAANIAHIVERGGFEALDELLSRTPRGLAEVMKVPGVGAKRAARLHEALGVGSLEDLEAAIVAGRVAALGGFGAKTADKIASGLDSYRRHSARTPIGVTLPLAQQLAAQIAALTGIDRVEVAGSVRRREETVGNIDLAAAAADREAARTAVAELPAVERLLESAGSVVRFELYDGIEVRVLVAEPDRFPAALQHATGSVAHNVVLAEIAARHGLAYGDTGLDTPLSAEGGDGQVYSAMGLAEIAPELRWGAEEIALAAEHRLPQLVTVDDIRGDLQSHSRFTDGKNTLLENRAVAAELGYEYFAATDHAYELRMVGGLDLSDLERQWAEIDEINATPGPRVLKGIELNIGADGSLDYDDATLARFDIVLASLHSGWDEPAEKVTARLIAAIEHPLVDIIAHPTGRVIGRRDPMRLDMDAVLEAAGRTGTIMEINSYPDRLDLSAEHIRLARSHKVRFSLGTDAHAAEQFRYMHYGVAQARRGMVTRDELLNAQPWDIAATWLKRSRY